MAPKSWRIERLFFGGIGFPLLPSVCHEVTAWTAFWRAVDRSMVSRLQQKRMTGCEFASQPHPRRPGRPVRTRSRAGRGLNRKRARVGADPGRVGRGPGRAPSLRTDRGTWEYRVRGVSRDPSRQPGLTALRSAGPVRAARPSLACGPPVPSDGEGKGEIDVWGSSSRAGQDFGLRGADASRRRGRPGPGPYVRPGIASARERRRSCLSVGDRPARFSGRPVPTSHSRLGRSIAAPRPVCQSPSETARRLPESGATLWRFPARRDRRTDRRGPRRAMTRPGTSPVTVACDRDESGPPDCRGLGLTPARSDAGLNRRFGAGTSAGEWRAGEDGVRPRRR